MEELNKDITELNSLRAQSVRPVVQQLLDNKLKELKQRLEQAQKASAPAASKATPSAAASSELPTVKLINYAFDQSDKFVKLYFPLKGVQSLDASKISTNFTARHFEVNVSDLNGKNYLIAVKDVLEDIVPESCQVKQKTDDLLVMLRKKEEAKNWGTLTRAAFLEKEKNTPKFDDKMDGADPQAGLMNMMKQMYETGDDEMKRNIRKSWHEGQNKKGGGGMPGMPGGMPGMPPMDF